MLIIANEWKSISTQSSVLIIENRIYIVVTISNQILYIWIYNNIYIFLKGNYMLMLGLFVYRLWTVSCRTELTTSVMSQNIQTWHWRSVKTRSYYFPFTAYTFPANNVCLNWIEGNEVENSVCLGGGVDLFQCGGWVWWWEGGNQLIPVVQQ